MALPGSLPPLKLATTTTMRHCVLAAEEVAWLRLQSIVHVIRAVHGPDVLAARRAPQQHARAGQSTIA